MLQNLHDNIKGWASYVIVGMLIVPFALWGINSYFDGGKAIPAATVNGEEISSMQAQNRLAQIRQQFGPMAANMDPTMLKNMALDGVITQELMRQKVKEQGYRATPQQVFDVIAGMEAFQKDGKFDRAQYESILNANRRSALEFEQGILDDLTNSQFQKGIAETAFITKAQATQYQALQNQKRDVSSFTVKAADFEAQIQVTDQQINEYYEKNKSSYMTEERIKVSYLTLKQDDYAKQVQVDEAGLQAYYEQNNDRYITPESRQTSHVLVAVTDPSKDAEAKAKADALYADIQANKKTFEQAVAESDDKNTAAKGGALGEVVVGDWDPNFEKAVFALELNKVSEPIKTQRGYELALVTAIKPAEQKSFADVKAQVETDFRNTEAEKIFQEKLQSVQNIAYEQSGDLAPAAKAAGLTIQESDWFTQNAGTGVAENPKVRQAAFSEDVLKSGKNSALIPVTDTEGVVVRLASQEAPAQKPLADVKEMIVASLKAEEARKQAEAKGKELLGKVKAGGWAALEAAGIPATAVQKSGLIGRSDSALNPELVQKAFSMERPAKDQFTWDSLILSTGDYVLLSVAAVQDGTGEADANIVKGYSANFGNREALAAIEALREQAKIERHPDSF